MSFSSMLRLLIGRVFALGMAATTLAFMGQFALSTYLRPNLQGVTGLYVNTLSLVLLGLGLAGLAGTLRVGFLLHAQLRAVLIGLPSALSLIAALLIVLGPYAVPVAALLMLWGLFTTPIPVAWNTWMTLVIHDELEAGGGLQVALIQFAITFGAAAGGLLFDSAGWWSPFVLGALLLVRSALFAVAASQSSHGATPRRRRSSAGGRCSASRWHHPKIVLAQQGSDPNDQEPTDMRVRFTFNGLTMTATI